MSRTFVLVALVFACLGLAAGLKGPFVHDDFSNLALVLLPQPSWQQALDAILSNGSGLLRRPLSNASFLFNFLLLGDSALAFKAVNLALHLVNGLLVYLLGRTLLSRVLPDDLKGKAGGISLAAAMLWLAHPLDVSTVLYVVQRMTVLSACFVLLGSWWLARHLAEPGNQGTRNKILAVAGFYFTTALALLSKESGALTPVYAAAMVLLLGHGDLPGFIRRHHAVLALTVGLPLALGLTGLAAGWHTIAASYTHRPFDLPERLASESVILWKYLGHIALPLPGRMHFFWDGEPVRHFGEAPVTIALLAWAGLAAAAIWRYRVSPWLLFALTWFLGGHAMESSIIALDLGYEHRNYLPMLGPIIAFTATAARWLQWSALPLRTISLAAVSLLLLATGLRALTWSSLPRLAAHEVTTVPMSLRAQYNAYAVAANAGRWEAAHRRLNRMEQIDASPDWIEVNRLTLHCQGDPTPLDGARIRRALRKSATDERTQRGLQQVLDLEVQGNCRGSLPYDLHTLLLDLARLAEERDAPLVAADYYYMAGSLDWSRGKSAESTRMLRRAAALAPQSSGPSERLVMVLLAQGDTQGALEALAHTRVIWHAHEPWRLYRYDAWRNAIDNAPITP